jgi:hypothetical protein
MLQFSPQASTRVIRMTAIPEPWSTPSKYSKYSSELGFLTSWFETEDAMFRGSINWGAVSGLALSIALSAAFWTALAVVVERIWK